MAIDVDAVSPAPRQRQRRPVGARDPADRRARGLRGRARRDAFRSSARAASRRRATRSSSSSRERAPISIGTANFTDPRVAAAHRRRHARLPARARARERRRHRREERTRALPDGTSTKGTRVDACPARSSRSTYPTSRGARARRPARRARRDVQDRFRVALRLYGDEIFALLRSARRPRLRRCEAARYPAHGGGRHARGSYGPACTSSTCTRWEASR